MNTHGFKAGEQSQDNEQKPKGKKEFRKKWEKNEKQQKL